MVEPKAYLGNAPYIFISYAHKNKEEVYPFIEALQEHYNVWFDEGLRYGKEWDEEIESQIDHCSVFMALITKDSLLSDYCWKEIRRAKKMGKPFFPCLIQDFFKAPLQNMEEWKLFLSDYGNIQSIPFFRFSSPAEAVEDLVRKCDEFEAMQNTKKVKYAFVFKTEGDGTCSVLGLERCADTDLVIPAVSPTGDCVTSIGQDAFLDCDFITSIVIPDSVSAIETGAFTGCKAMANVSFGNGVTKIGMAAFEHCDSLAEVALPEGVTSIGSFAFDSCKSLQSLVIPNSVLEIEWCAFMDCEHLETIAFGNGIRSIGMTAFSLCTALKDIFYAGTKAEWKAVQKGDKWNHKTGKYVVHCTDGDLKKPLFG